MSAIIPQPRCPIHVRPGTMDDVPFMDALQKLHSKQVGWMPTKQFEGKVRAGHVIVAEERRTEDSGLRTECYDPQLSPQSSALSPVPFGYCIGNDRYFKRDDVGIIYQMNVAPGHQRGFIGASLLKAQFERSAYGCRLYCCWCAQDIEANRFWEAMGFVPLAYRAGSEKKSRVHIFWQRRIRAGDTTTPWWFPAQTSGGSIREDRIVLPIPPGTHWSDAKPLVLPQSVVRGQLSVAKEKGKRATEKGVAMPAKPGPLSGGLSFAPPAPPVAAEAEKKPREKKPKAKNDPKLIAAARELRDRYLEHVNSERILAPAPGKYDVSRPLPVAERTTVLRLEAA